MLHVFMPVSFEFQDNWVDRSSVWKWVQPWYVMTMLCKMAVNNCLVLLNRVMLWCGVVFWVICIVSHKPHTLIR